MTDSGATEIPERIGKYRVTGKLGEGGMGVVYAARDDDLHRDVAVKVVRASDDSGEQLLREARALARLSHPNVVTVHEVGRSDDGVYVAMELVRGRTLDAWMAEHPNWRERVAVLVQAARGLQAAHRAGLIHRDFKPANIIVGNDGRARVVDFGLAVAGASAPGGAAHARAASELERFTRTGDIVGTPQYMAPEQWRAEDIDARTDQFAFCAVAFKALFGARPFAGESIAEIRRSVLAADIAPLEVTSVPAEITDAIRRGLANNPADRHQDMTPLLDALSLDGAVARRAPWLIAAAVTLLALAAVTLLAFRQRDLLVLEPVVAADLRAAVLASSQLPAPVEAPLSGDPMNVTVHHLSNGLTVYLSPDPDEPTITAWTVFRAGSRHDPPGLSGLAHVVEHMAMQGSERVGTIDSEAERPHLERLRALSTDLVAAPEGGARVPLWRAINRATGEAAAYEVRDELRRTLDQLGAREVGAEVGQDSTVFRATFPDNRLETWLALEADRWQNPVFRNFYPELDAILEEAHREQPRARLERALLSLVFGDHAYGRRAAGDPAELRRATILEAEAFFERWYVPNNAALILTGDIDRQKTLAAIEAALSDWEPRPLPQAQAAPPTAPDESVKTIEYGGPPTAVLAWRGPPLSHPDAAALSALGRLLDNPVAGVLSEHLAGLADIETIDARLAGRVEGGWFEIRASALQDIDARRVATGISRAIDRVRRGDFDPELVEAIAAQEAVGDLRRARQADVRLESLRTAFAQRVDWRDAVSARTRARDITAKQLVEVADRYLREPLELIAIPGASRLSEREPLPLDPVAYAAAEHSGWVEALLARPAVPTEPKFLIEGRHFGRGTTGAGTLITVPNRRDSMFRLSLRWDVGEATIPLVCAALDAYENVPSPSPEVADRRLAWMRLGMSLTVSCEAGEVSIDVLGDDAHFEDSVAAVHRFLEGELLEPAALARSLRDHARRRAAAAMTADSIVAGARWRARLGPDAPRLSLPDPRIAGASAGDIRAAIGELADTRRVTLYYGPRGEDEVAAIVGRRPASRSFEHHPVRFMRPAQTRVVVVDDPRRRTASVSVELPLERPREPQHLMFELVGEHLGGADNPIAAHLHRAAQIDGGVTSGLRIPSGAGDDAYAFVHLRVGPGDAATAAREALVPLRALVIDPERFERISGALATRYRADWIGELEIAEAVRRWYSSGLAKDPRPDRFRLFRRLSAADLLAVTRAIGDAPAIITVVGDARRLDMAELRSLGAVTVVGAAELYQQR